ncbi:SagB/ThcOx family dehydrogenase [Bacteroidales bacterium OttesenSCG-928-A17]|nr:SagB/ThcOx family dehydrogenase [Bacteroidales bacterium OttesenSCG-928-A17]
MKHSILSIMVLALSVVSCQQAKQEPTVYSPQQTEPMEITSFETLQLQKPDLDSGDALMKIFQNRKSTREYSDRNISLKHLSEILWAANGINREDGRRTVPSAVALYPLKTYAVLANGIYLYDPAAHELQPVVEGDYREFAGLQPFVKTAPLNLLFIADYSKYQGDRPIPQEKWLYLASLDAGHCTQNVYLYCASEGLKTVVRAGAQEAKLLELLSLKENHQFIVAQTIGY